MWIFGANCPSARIRKELTGDNSGWVVAAALNHEEVKSASQVADNRTSEGAAAGRGIASERCQQQSGFEIPKPERSVLRSRPGTLTVRANCNSIHGISVTSHCPQFLPCFQVPRLQCLVMRRRNDPSTIGSDHHA